MNKYRKIVALLAHKILLLSLLVTIVFVGLNPANLSDGGTQSMGCVTIKVQYQDGCPRPGAYVWIRESGYYPEHWFCGQTNESGYVAISLPSIRPNFLYRTNATWPDRDNLFSYNNFITDENGNANVTITKYSNHPNAFVMNLTSPTNYVSGFTENALNDSSTTKDLIFAGNESKTVWIRLPKQSTVLDAKLTLDVRPQSYTEWIDVEDYYSYQGSFNRPASNAVDENWGTYAQPNEGTVGIVNETYNLPSYWEDIIGIQWEAKGHDGYSPYDSNYITIYFWNYTGEVWSIMGTIPQTSSLPWYTTTITVAVNPNDFLREGHTFKVSTVIDYRKGYADDQHYYEGKVRWGLGPSPTNPYIDIGNDGDKEWSHPGKFNQSEIVSNLSAAINEYVSSAAANAHNEVDVPLVLHSDTAGTMQISNINVTYLYNATSLYNVGFVEPLIGYEVNRTDYNPVEVCIHGFYVNNSSTMATIDGVQHTIKTLDGHKYAELVELIPVGVATPWSNHTVWWDTLSSPIVNLLSPESKTYNTNSIGLNFTVNEPTTWIGYSLDGQEFETISGNTTLNLADGFHNIIVNVTDGTGDWGTSEIVYFTVSTHDVAVMSVSSSHTEAIMGQAANITVRVKNEGIYAESFNVTAYYDDNDIQTQEVTDLSPGNQADLIFNWNTIGIPVDAYYTIKAQTSILTNEFDLVDNTLTNGTVVIRTLKTIEVTPCDHAGNPKGSFETGSMAYFKVKINNTALEPANLLMTINIYDLNNTAIGVASFQGSLTSGLSTFIIGVPIPSSAHLGNATVYANAFTDWPRNGGTPYCPEISATFQIIGP